MNNTNKPTTMNPTSATHQRRCFSLAICLLLGASIAEVQADSIFIPDFSFEDVDYADGTGAFDLVPGWTRTGGGGNASGVFDSTDTFFPGTSGAGNLPAPGHGQQTSFLHVADFGSVDWFSAASLGIIQPNTTYTLTVAIGVSLDFPVPVNAGQGSIFIRRSGFLQAAQTTFSPHTLTPGTFTDFTTTFTTGESGGFIGEPFSVGVGYGGPISSGIKADNVRLDATVVPEPTAAAFLLSSSLLLLRRRSGLASERNG